MWSVTRRIALFAVCGPIFAVALAACGPTVRPTQSQPTAVQWGWEGVNYVPIGFDDFYDEWSANPSAADAKYSGRPNGVKFTGKIAAFTVTDANQTVMRVTAVDAADGKRVVNVGILTERARAGLNRRKAGDVVEVRAVGGTVDAATPLVVAYSVEPAK